MGHGTLRTAPRHAVTQAQLSCSADCVKHTRSSCSGNAVKHTRLRSAASLVLALGLVSSFLFVAHAQPIAGTSPRAFAAPDPKTIPQGPMGASILYGEKLVTQTQIHAKAYV